MPNHQDHEHCRHDRNHRSRAPPPSLLPRHRCCRHHCLRHCRHLQHESSMLLPLPRAPSASILRRCCHPPSQLLSLPPPPTRPPSSLLLPPPPLLPPAPPPPASGPAARSFRNRPLIFLSRAASAVERSTSRRRRRTAPPRLSACARCSAKRGALVQTAELVQMAARWARSMWAWPLLTNWSRGAAWPRLLADPWQRQWWGSWWRRWWRW